MSDSALIVRNDTSREISFTHQANQLKSDALEKSALIAKVGNADEQTIAVEAQQNLATLRRNVEKARKAAKEPVLMFGKLIDEKAKEFDAGLAEEEMRIAQLVGSFQQLEAAKAKAALNKENERLSELQRERQAALAEAKTHEDMDRINEEFGNRIEQEAPGLEAPVRAEGQRVITEWSVNVTDIWTLARSHPTCVNIEPRMAEIKSLLNMGVKVAGVTANKVIKSSVTVKRGPTAIDV